MKCYKRYIPDGEFSRWVYYIPTDKAFNGNIIWSTLKGCSYWKPGLFMWEEKEGMYKISVDKEGMQEVSELEVLVMTGCTPEQALEEAGCNDKN